MKAHYETLGYTSGVYLLINDATSVLPAIGYDPLTDCTSGFDISDDLLPHVDVRAGESLRDFLKRFHDYKLATQVEIYLLVPLAARIPPYVVGAFAQSGSQTMETITRRLGIVRVEMEKRGALILTWAADGATAQFKLMRQLRSLPPGAPFIEIPNVPTLRSNGTTIRLPARLATLKDKSTLIATTPILDPVHLINLYRNAPLRKCAAMRIGACPIDLLVLREELMKNLKALCMETELGVRLSDWAVSDRMNYASAQRFFSTRVLD